MAKSTLVSGIQPTGRLHLGNYLGALKNFVELQNSGKYNCYFFIADLHSLNEGFEPKEKAQQITGVTIDYLAAGLSQKKSTIFLQSAVPAHAELTIILNNIAPFGELSRMTQFKEKSAGQPHNVNVGLFDYPVMMTADILLYDAKHVPIGDDQLQHLELTRTLARKFNSLFGKTFVEPSPILTKVPRLMSLDDPNKKMAKSRPSGCLFLDDSSSEIKHKIMRATTDSGKEIKYDLQHKAGISNLMLIYSSLSGKSIKEVENKFRNKNYSEFKSELADVVIKALAPFQKNKKELSKKITQIKKVLIDGSKKAERIASKKLLEVKKKIGLLV